MWRWLQSTFRTMLVSLLMLTTPFVYAAPSYASPMPHGEVATARELVLVNTHDGATVMVAADNHDQGRCKGLELPDGGARCNVAQCAMIHGLFPVAGVRAFLPHVGASNPLPALTIPEGRITDPALRPPRPTI